MQILGLYYIHSWVFVYLHGMSHEMKKIALQNTRKKSAFRKKIKLINKYFYFYNKIYIYLG